MPKRYGRNLSGAYPALPVFAAESRFAYGGPANRERGDRGSANRARGSHGDPANRSGRSRSGQSRARSSSSGGSGPWIARYPLVVLLIATVALALLSEVPWIGSAIRLHIVHVLVVGFFVALFSINPITEKLKSMAATASVSWLLLLILWCVAITIYPPTSTLGFGDLMRRYALPELLRIVLCAGVFVAAAYGLRGRDLRPLLVGLQVLCSAFTVYGLFQAGTTPDHTMTSIFGNHEQAGTFMMLFLPFTVALAIDPNNGKSLSLGAQGVSVLLACGLILSRTRSAWIGEICGLAALAAIWLRFSPIRLSKIKKTQVVGPALIAGVGLLAFIFTSGLHGQLAKRLSTFANGAEDASLADRIHRWVSACRMLYERPLTGWGLGSFPILQRRWTGIGDSPDWALVHGTGHSNLAHDFYVQWGAETGIAGLALYVAAVAAFLLAVGILVPRMRPGFERSLLIGSIAATVCACADMVGSPSYTYPGESVFAWLLMGIGIAAYRVHGQNESGSFPRTPAWIWGVSAAVGIGVALVAFVVGARHPRVGNSVAKEKSFRLLVVDNSCDCGYIRLSCQGADFAQA